MFLLPFSRRPCKKHHRDGSSYLDYLICEACVDIEATFFSVPGSNLFPTDREHLASSSASSATDTYRGISVIVLLSPRIL